MRDKNRRWTPPFEVKLTAFELKALEKNRLAAIKVPYLDEQGRLTGRQVTVRVYPDNVDQYGRIQIYRRGKRIYSKRRR